MKPVPVTYMEIYIEGQKFECLLDTGCDFSIIPRRYIPTAELQPANVTITAANGSRIEILGCCEVDFRVQGMPVKAQLLVSNDVHDFLLGYDWLAAEEAYWNFTTRTLILHGVHIVLTAKNVRPSVCI